MAGIHQDVGTSQLDASFTVRNIPTHTIGGTPMNRALTKSEVYTSSHGEVFEMHSGREYHIP
jgi:hypothetical protein